MSWDSGGHMEGISIQSVFWKEEASRTEAGNTHGLLNLGQEGKRQPSAHLTISRTQVDEIAIGHVVEEPALKSVAQTRHIGLNSSQDRLGGCLKESIKREGRGSASRSGHARHAHANNVCPFPSIEEANLLTRKRA